MQINIGKNLEKMRARAKEVLDAHFARRAERNPYLMQAYQRKAAVAQMYLVGLAQGQQSVPAVLGHEAAARKISAKELAESIIVKAQESWNTLDVLEVERQQALAAIRNATTVLQIETVIGAYQLSIRESGVL